MTVERLERMLNKAKEWGADGIYFDIKFDEYIQKMEITAFEYNDTDDGYLCTLATLY